MPKGGDQPEGLTEPRETACRVKAARAYAELTREQLVARTGLAPKTLKLIEEGKRQSTTREELLKIARACGVPDEFMEIGFQGAQDVYTRLQWMFAVVLSQDMPAILAEADRLGVLDKFRPPAPYPNPGDAHSRASEPRPATPTDEASGAADPD